MGDYQRQLIRFEETFQQQDGFADAGGAQFQRLLDAGHAKAICFRLQRAGASNGPMPIGIGFDHRQRLAATQRTRQPVVVAQGLQVDQGTGGTQADYSCVAGWAPYPEW